MNECINENLKYIISSQDRIKIDVTNFNEYEKKRLTKAYCKLLEKNANSAVKTKTRTQEHTHTHAHTYTYDNHFGYLLIFYAFFSFFL